MCTAYVSICCPRIMENVVRNITPGHGFGLNSPSTCYTNALIGSHACHDCQHISDMFMSFLCNGMWFHCNYMMRKCLYVYGLRWQELGPRSIWQTLGTMRKNNLAAGAAATFLTRNVPEAALTNGAMTRVYM